MKESQMQKSDQTLTLSQGQLDGINREQNRPVWSLKDAAGRTNLTILNNQYFI